MSRTQQGGLSVSLGYTRLTTGSAVCARSDLQLMVESIEDVLTNGSMTERMRTLLESNLCDARRSLDAGAASGSGSPGTGAAHASVPPHGNHGDNLLAGRV